MSKKARRLKTAKVTEQSSNTPHEDHSPRVHQRSKIDFQLDIAERKDITARQQELLDLILDRKTRVIFLSGPAGTAKTYMAVAGALHLLNKRGVSDIVYIRSVVESASKSMGYLPGEAGDKLAPYMRPLLDKLDELLPRDQVERLTKEKRAEAIPVGFLRGASINAKVMICDESQNLCHKELVTVLTRLGKFSKLIVAGDPGQSDIGSHSGFQSMFDLFNDEESKQRGIHCFSFTTQDIVRSDILGYIVDKIEGRPPTEPMFNSS
jgi:phosphate starvation-inducible PhoH-like protein